MALSSLGAERAADNMAVFAEAAKRIFPSSVNGMEWLKGIGFFSAPASTKYHGSFEGGLLDHSLGVLHFMASFIKTGADPSLRDAKSFQSMATVALLHDVCKCDIYKKRTTRVKTDDGWSDAIEWTYCDGYPFGHGEKSCDLIAEAGLRLTREERLAIRWHMGAYCLSERELEQYRAAIAQSNLLFPLHTADMMETLYTRNDNSFLKKFIEAIPY